MAEEKFFYPNPFISIYNNVINFSTQGLTHSDQDTCGFEFLLNLHTIHHPSVISLLHYYYTSKIIIQSV